MEMGPGANEAETITSAGKEKKEANLKQNADTELSINDKSNDHNTRKEMAEDLGWGLGKVAQAEQVWNKGEVQTAEIIASTTVVMDYDKYPDVVMKQVAIDLAKAYQEKQRVTHNRLFDGGISKTERQKGDDILKETHNFSGQSDE